MKVLCLNNMLAVRPYSFTRGIVLAHKCVFAILIILVEYCQQHPWVSPQMCVFTGIQCIFCAETAVGYLKHFETQHIFEQKWNGVLVKVAHWILNNNFQLRIQIQLQEDDSPLQNTRNPNQMHLTSASSLDDKHHIGPARMHNESNSFRLMMAKVWGILDHSQSSQSKAIQLINIKIWSCHYVVHMARPPWRQIGRIRRRWT